NISGNGTIYYRYHRNGPDSSGWSSLKNLSQIVPGSYTGHQNPSLTASGTSGDKTLHVAWEATYTGGLTRLIHRKATDWYTWPNNYTVFQSNTSLRQPSITGLSAGNAHLLFQDMVNQNEPDIYKVNYNGVLWNLLLFVSTGTNPSVSVGNTTAKYVWKYGSSAPYQIKTSTETLSKTVADPLAMAYHRSIAIIDTTTNAWLEVRLDKLAVKTRRGEEFVIPFTSAKEDSLTLRPANAFSNLASSPVALPADAESLAVQCQVSGQGLSAIKNAANPIAVEIVFTGKKGATLRVPIINISTNGLAETKIYSARGTAAFAGGEVSVRTEVAGFRNKPSLIASLGHIYEIVETPLPKALESITETATPQAFFLEAYPNPFNPSTQIRFAMKEAGVATLRVYNLNGQLVRELLNEYRPVGEHSIPWDGRNDRGVTAASGVYFIRFEAGKEVKLNKVMLVR
ncbi:MAG: T9SS type A sorting domain-containing protein, partial [bacterium]